jgi:hypothetical protein
MGHAVCLVQVQLLAAWAGRVPDGPLRAAGGRELEGSITAPHRAGLVACSTGLTVGGTPPPPPSY